jgi:glycosyltransferase involved in cell wall biosynthesis
MDAENSPLVSIIVPARNEEACLGACLQSLVAQTGIAFEIIVVDDISTDRTAEIAKSFVYPGEDARGSTDHVGAGALTRPPVHVISAPPLSDNWTGKNNAMSAGAKLAKAKWLLFTDADTIHKPGSLARAVAEAEQHGAALLSYSPDQEVRTFWEKAVMPVIFAELAATYPPKKVNDPALPIAAANGQYLLISREAYDAIGGHTKIANDLLEDVALARLVKSSGRKIFFRYGGDAVRTRMYRNWAQMKEGWTKNLALLFKEPVQLAGQNIALSLMIVLAPLLALRDLFFWGLHSYRGDTWLHWYSAVLEIVVFMWATVLFARRLTSAHFPIQTLFLSALGLPIFSYLLLRSDRAYKRARVDWKDRSYVYTPEQIDNLRRNREDERSATNARRSCGSIVS